MVKGVHIILMYVNQIHGVLAPLAEKLEKYGVCVIDQSKGINGKEIRLTEEEIGKLQPEGLYEDWMTCRTDLSRTGKRFLGLKNYEIMTMPEREKVRLTFQTNPDMRLLLASEPCFREGRAATKANHVVRVDRNWSPGCEAQTLGRVLRPGQIKQVHEWLLKISNTIEEGKYNYIDWKAVAINLAEKGAALDEDQRELFMKRQKPENSTVMQSEASKTTADIIASMSRDMSSEHSEEHVRTRLLQSENAAWYAFLYSEDWETAYSGHSAKAQKEIIEDLYGLKLGVTRDNLENILDLASGPAVISRVLKRETTCVELNRYQLMEGKKYHEEESEIKIKNKYLMGSMQNLNNLVELEDTDQIVFDSSIAGNKRAKMESESQDLVVCSLAFHYMSCEQRQKTVREIYRTLKKDKYFVLALPKNTIDESCSMAFAQDFVNEGFEVDFSRTGTYQPSKVETASGTQKESSSFEVYILVAKKVEKDPEAQPRDDAFELEAEMMSVEPKLKMDKKKGMPNHDKEGELCSEFYNTDTGYSPKLGVVSDYIPPDAPEDKAPRTVEELFGPDAASTPADQKKGYKGTIQDPDVQEPYAPADELDSQDLLARTKKLGADGGSILARLNRILDKNGD